MPIAVVCSSCKARFQVSEKFAGKQGPCPKCKSIITIPKVEEQVQIHAPEEAAKVATGEPTLKPIMQGNEAPADSDRDRRLCDAGSARHWPPSPARYFRISSRSPDIALLPSRYRSASPAMRFVRELEPHRGKWLWVRATVCGLGLTALWIAYWFIPVDLRTSAWSWFFIAPALLSIGGASPGPPMISISQRLPADLLLRRPDHRPGMVGRVGNAVERDPLAVNAGQPAP